MNSAVKFIVLTGFFICSLTLGNITGIAQAARPDYYDRVTDRSFRNAVKVRRDHRHQKPIGKVLHNAGFTRPQHIHHGRHIYRYDRHRGLFSRPSHRPGSYIRVTAPLGIVVSSLPYVYTTVVVDRTPYYISEGTYYRRVNSGYMVVETPPRVQRTYPAADLVVRIDQANLRSGPGKNHPVTGQVFYGQPLRLVGEAPNWYYVQHPHGHYGWIKVEYARIDSGN